MITGRGLEDPAHSRDAFPVKVVDEAIWLLPQAKRGYRPPAVAISPEPRSLVVVGNGMAAMRAVEEVLERAPGQRLLKSVQDRLKADALRVGGDHRLNVL